MTAAASSMLIAGASSCLAAAPSLADLLTPEEFERAGLKKLTPEELAFLGEALFSRAAAGASPTQAAGKEGASVDEAESARKAAAAAGSDSDAGAKEPGSPYPFHGDDAFGQEQKLREQLETAHGAPDVLTSRITGRFRGWRGKTVFKLENGQVWQQIDDRRFVVDLENPVVNIERGSFGAYFLRIEGYGSRTKVRRLE